jgi:site-specific recombinase XerD
LSIPPSIKPRPPKLLDRVREIIRIKHYSYRTEETYVFWIRRYILFHDQQHPKDMNSAETEAFLSHLAIKENLAASTQNQALSALLLLYREILKIELNTPVDALRAKRPRYLPTVFTKEEAFEVIRHLSGTYQLIVQLL